MKRSITSLALVAATALGVALPVAGDIVSPAPAAATFNDNACIIREGYNVSKIINGEKWSLYGVRSYPGQICLTALWVRR